jgi:hypothetical protein
VPKKNHKTRHLSKRPPRPGPTPARGAVDRFRMVVAANPGTSPSVDPELDLIKAALLYGDTVKVLSPVTTIFLGVEGLEGMSPRQQIDLMRKTAPLILSDDEAVVLEEQLPQIEATLRSHGGSIGDRLQREAVRRLLAPISRKLSEGVRELAGGAGIDQLERARDVGLLEIESADAGSGLDFIVSLLRSATLAQSGQRNDDGLTDRIAESFLDRLSRHLSSGREYLIFDEPIARLVDAAIREGLFRPAKGPAGKCAQAMSASGFMGRLPTFPNATVDEIVDIRSELAPALTQFRSKMVTVSKAFSSGPWETDFEDEVHDAWVEEVNPALENIDASVRDNASLLSVSAGLGGAASSAYPGLAIAAAGLAGHLGAVTLVGGALAGVTPLLKALHSQKIGKHEVRMQPFYFLYSLDQALTA